MQHHRCYAIGCMNDNGNRASDGEANAKPDVIKLALDLTYELFNIRVKACS